MTTPGNVNSSIAQAEAQPNPPAAQPPSPGQGLAIFALNFPQFQYQGPSPMPLSTAIVPPLRFIQNAGATPSSPPARTGNHPGGATGFPKAGGINPT